MRIIRKAAALAMVLMVIAPQVSWADTLPGIDSNEIKTNFETQNNSNNNGIVLGVQNGQLAMGPTVATDYALATTDDSEWSPRDIALAEFEEAASKMNSSGEEFAINASAYTAASDECGKSDGITASGLKVKEDETIACPENFSFGTKVKIKGMGTYVCEDRGGAIHGNRFDIYMKTKKQAFDFGRRQLTAQVVM
ncbi:MAG: 3D domain-containing protein [Candidatus Pacebacteria bacterium]|nr:3D domain-containing protein [Candidatus Paceibacterota bacterium]